MNQNQSEGPVEYAPFIHETRDPWRNTHVELTFHFAKPTSSQFKRLHDSIYKDALQAYRNLLLPLVRPDEKERLLGTMEDYPGIVPCFAYAIQRAVGYKADLEA